MTTDTQTFHGLTLCGSLRQGSSNETLLDVYRTLAKPALDLKRCEGISSLPHFDPNLGDDELPSEVHAIRQLVRDAQVLVFSTPEYIHAMPAVLKNLLEWLVGDPAFYQKPVIILQANRTSVFAVESLQEVLRTMSATLIDTACLSIEMTSNQTTKQAILENTAWVDLIKGSIAAVLKYLSENT